MVIFKNIFITATLISILCNCNNKPTKSIECYNKNGHKHFQSYKCCNDYRHLNSKKRRKYNTQLEYMNTQGTYND